MRAICRAAASSALLFVLVAYGAHPASAAEAATISPPEDAPVSVLIAEFYPCAVSGDEYVSLRNCGDEAVTLDRWTLADGEGVLAFDGIMLEPSATLVLSECGESYERAFGITPHIDTHHWTYADCLTISGSFRLADAGDELELRDPEGTVIDAISYGSGDIPALGWSGEAIPCPRQGEVARRMAHDSCVTDSDTSLDWTPFREYRYGFTDADSPLSLVRAGNVTGFISPDCSLDCVCGAIREADSNIRVCCYELSSVPISKALEASLSAGVAVTVLVESSPVGGMSDGQMACLSRLVEKGGDVRVLGGNLEEDIVRHVGTLHSKYIVVDEELLLCLSENLVDDGVPSDRIFGNRGWGVSVRDDSLAAWLAGLFDEDSRADRCDVWDWRSDPRFVPLAQFPEESSSEHQEGLLSPHVTEAPSRVVIYASPDASPIEPYLSSLIRNSNEILFEQFQADLLWTDRWSGEAGPSPVIGSIVAAMANGAGCRGLFDASWYNVEDNGLVRDALTANATRLLADAEFGSLDERSPIGILHNKGMVLDDSVVVSSNNWVRSSFARNRELAVVVESPSLADYFSHAFYLDWVPDTVDPVADAGEDMIANVTEQVILDGSGSWDDRAMANWSWDIEGDGSWDAYGMAPEITFQKTGELEVVLRVADSWGNVAYDTVLVEVMGPGRFPEGSSGGWSPVFALLGSAAGALLALFAISRKLNLIPPGSRGNRTR